MRAHTLAVTGHDERGYAEWFAKWKAAMLQVQPRDTPIDLW